MANTFRFREFPVYKDAKRFRKLVKSLLKKFPLEEKFALVDQINRSCLSVLLNIAEGSAKKSDKEFARFLETSISSLNEVMAGFDIAYDDQIITAEDFQEIKKQSESIAKQLGGFIKELTSQL